VSGEHGGKTGLKGRHKKGGGDGGGGEERGAGLRASWFFPIVAGGGGEPKTELHSKSPGKGIEPRREEAKKKNMEIRYASSLLRDENTQKRPRPPSEGGR